MVKKAHRVAKKYRQGAKARPWAMTPRTNGRKPRGSFRTNGRKPSGSLVWALPNGRTIQNYKEDIRAFMWDRKKQDIVINIRDKIGELRKQEKSSVSGQFGQIHFCSLEELNEVVFKLIPFEMLIMKEGITLIEQIKIEDFRSATRSEIKFYNLINGVQEFRNSHCPRRHAVQQTTECVAIIYGYCGPDMFSYLQKNRPTMNPFDLLNLAIKVLEVCLAMFNAGVYHLDIKPENILYDGKRVMICDWGRWTMDANEIINRAGTFEFTAPDGYPARFYTLWTIMATLADVMFEYSPQYSHAEGDDHNLEIRDWLNEWKKAEWKKPGCSKLEPLSIGFTRNWDRMAGNRNYLPLCNLFKDFFSKTRKKPYTLSDIIGVFNETKDRVLSQSSTHSD